MLAVIVALALLVSMLAVPGWAEPAESSVPDTVVSSNPVTASGTEIASGYCGGEGDGTNLAWELTEDGTLTISGEGAMADWGHYSYVPWHSYGNDIQTVVIGDSVTTIGTFAFAYRDSLTSVTIGDSVTTIGEGVFCYCDGLASVTIPDSVTTIGEYAFLNCKSLLSVTIPDSVTTIGDEAFFGCAGLTEVTIPASVITIGNRVFLRVTRVRMP